MDSAALVAGATFLLVVLLVMGPYFLLVERPEAANQEMLRQRIKTGGAAVRPRTAGGSLLKEVERLSVIGPLHKALAGSSAIASNLRDVVQMSGLKMTPGQIVLGSGCLALVAYLLTFLWIPRATLAALVGLLMGSIPYMVLRFLRARRLDKFEEQFPEAVDLISRTLRAGHAFTTGLRMASDELPEPVSAEFKLLYDQQNYGMPLNDGLRAFAKRVPLIDSRFFVTAVLTQREAGGNLAEVLDNLAAVIRERFKIKRQLRVISAHGRMTGMVLASLPPSLGLFLMFRSPEHFRILIEDPTGQKMIMVAVFLQILGAFLIHKITKVEYEAVPIQMLLTLGAVFLSVAFLAGVTVSLVLSRSTSVGRRRLSELSQPRTSGGPVVVEEAALAEVPDPEWNRLLNALPTSRGSVKRLRREMALAGFNTARAGATLSITELTLPILLGVPPIFLLIGMNRWYGAGLGAVIGYMGPGFILSRRIKKRKKQIENGLADALDLLVLCLEAGSSLDQAIVKASEELGVAYPALGDQLHILISEMRAGKPRLEAFRGLADRTQVDDVRALVAMLIQTDKFGTSVSQALRTHAEVCRTKRRQRAEERSQKVGVKLVFPLVFCLFPALYVVMLGPAYLEFVKVFGGK